MFDLSLESLFVLGLLAFILFGPQKLPEYAAKLGRLVAQLRKATSEMTRQVNNPFEYPPEPGHEPTPHYEPPLYTHRGDPDALCPHCQGAVYQEYVFCPHCGRRTKEEQLDLPFNS